MRWQNAQAVSNLLIHPALIPEDIRLAALFRGLRERKVVCYVLSAVVGFQGVDPGELAATDRERVLAELLAIVREMTGILTKRASVSFRSFAGEADAPQVLALMGHSDDTVRHNLRAWLFGAFQSRGVEPFTAAVRRSGLAENVQRRMVGEFTTFVTSPPQGLKNPLLPLWGYIPNLRDV